MSLQGYKHEHAPELTDAQKETAKRIGSILRTHKRGASNAVVSHRIERAMSLNAPLVRSMIRYLRRDLRLPICSSGNGYYWAATQQELETCINHLRSRRNSLDETLAEMEAIRV